MPRLSWLVIDGGIPSCIQRVNGSFRITSLDPLGGLDAIPCRSMEIGRRFPLLPALSGLHSHLGALNVQYAA